MATTVYGIIFERDKAEPVQAGRSILNLEAGERKIRSALKKAFPNIREARLTPLRPDKHTEVDVPRWFERIGGIINFSADALVARVARVKKRKKKTKRKPVSKRKRR